MERKAKKFAAALTGGKSNRNIFARFIFSLMGKMISGYEPGSILERDRLYWKEKGWPGKKPF